MNLDLAAFPTTPLTVASSEGPIWQGTVEGLALYSRSLSDDEIRANTAAYTNVCARRKPVPSVHLEVHVVGISTMPTIKDIRPYTRAMSVYEYEIVRIVDGAFTGKNIRVAHWVILDKEFQPISRVPVGAYYRLVVEPFDANPQLEGEMLGDTLDDEDIPLYYGTKLFLPPATQGGP